MGEILVGPSIDHMLKQTRNHHVQLSSLADSKANMLITAASLVLTLSIRYIMDPELKWISVCLISFCILTILLAAYSAMPKMSLFLKKQKGDAADNPNLNILFFGDFIKLSYDEYEARMIDVINNPVDTYKVQLHEIYTLGLFLTGKKYRFLKLAYISFICGLLICGVAIVISLF